LQSGSYAVFSVQEEIVLEIPLSNNAALEATIAEVVRKFNQPPAATHWEYEADGGAVASNYDDGASVYHFRETASVFDDNQLTGASGNGESNSNNTKEASSIINGAATALDNMTTNFSASLSMTSEPLGSRAGTDLDRELEQLVQNVSDKVDEVLQEFCEKDANLKEVLEDTADVDVSFCVNLRAKDLVGSSDLSKERRTSTFLTELDDSEDETEDKEEASRMEMVEVAENIVLKQVESPDDENVTDMNEVTTVQIESTQPMEEDVHDHPQADKDLETNKVCDNNELETITSPQICPQYEYVDDEEVNTQIESSEETRSVTSKIIINENFEVEIIEFEEIQTVAEPYSKEDSCIKSKVCEDNSEEMSHGGMVDEEQSLVKQIDERDQESEHIGFQEAQNNKVEDRCLEEIEGTKLDKIQVITQQEEVQEILEKEKSEVHEIQEETKELKAEEVQEILQKDIDLSDDLSELDESLESHQEELKEENQLEFQETQPQKIKETMQEGTQETQEEEAQEIQMEGTEEEWTQTIQEAQQKVKESLQVFEDLDKLKSRCQQSDEMEEQNDSRGPAHELVEESVENLDSIKDLPESADEIKPMEQTASTMLLQELDNQVLEQPGSAEYLLKSSEQVVEKSASIMSLHESRNQTDEEPSRAGYLLKSNDLVAEQTGDPMVLQESADQMGEQPSSEEHLLKSNDPVAEQTGDPMTLQESAHQMVEQPSSAEHLLKSNGPVAEQPRDPIVLQETADQMVEQPSSAEHLLKSNDQEVEQPAISMHLHELNEQSVQQPSSTELLKKNCELFGVGSIFGDEAVPWDQLAVVVLCLFLTFITMLN
jgi:hypothetical protein